MIKCQKVSRILEKQEIIFLLTEIGIWLRLILKWVVFSFSIHLCLVLKRKHVDDHYLIKKEKLNFNSNLMAVKC